ELLGLEASDYDVATDATPDRVRGLFKRTALVGAHFGVVLVKSGAAGGRRDIVTEVATFRSDGAYSDRRRPDSVTFSDARSDALRRDFTVNALFLDPLADRDTERHADVPPMGREAEASGVGATMRGQIVDFVGGIVDLDARVLRAVGDPDKRLGEDHLRALRAVRLAAKLGLAIEAGTAAAIRRHAQDLAGVSHERVGDEMRRVLGHPSRAVGVRLLQDLGLDGPVLGSQRPAAVPARLGRLDAAASVEVCLAAMALDRGEVDGPEGVQALLTAWRRSLCLSNEEREGTRDALAAYFVLRREFETLGVAAQKRLAAGAGYPGAVAVLEAEDPDRAGLVRGRVAELAATPGGLAPDPVVTGDELIGLGMTPGPGFSGLLAAAYDAQLEGLFGDREGGVRWVRARERGESGGGSG
ncbi:MAG: CCA tRNA nucleotidyltransferase, partial [Phycisphaerales bacterium]|nr:CCA tRNA nucleotidyltransferase [Phycisphaerales bacterium]